MDLKSYLIVNFVGVKQIILITPSLFCLATLWKKHGTRPFDFTHAQVVDYFITQLTNQYGCSLTDTINEEVQVPVVVIFPSRRSCIVPGCTNWSDEGGFVGELCAPCHEFLVTGRPNKSRLWTNSKNAVVSQIP